MWEELLAARDDDWLDVLAARKTGPEDWRKLALRGGFPPPALTLRTGAERALWFDGYERTYLERDLQNLSAIASLSDFRRLMRAAARCTGQMLNQTELARDTGLPQPTVHRWLNLLETSSLAVRLPAFSVNRSRRLIKSPRLYWADTGLALHLAGLATPAGAHLENLILAALLAWRDARLERAELTYWRTVSGDEVDFVIEAGDRCLPVEVKATTRPRLADVAHLRVPGRVRQEGTRGALPPRRHDARVARARRAGGALVAGSVRRKRSHARRPWPAQSFRHEPDPRRAARGGSRSRRV